MKWNISVLNTIIATVIIFSSCERETLLTDSNAKIKFSKDTITFDTVFTSIGSATKTFLVYNPYNEPIKISNIRLSGGKNSFFKINVDGAPGPDINDIRIEAKDSAHVFVQVLIDPSNISNPIEINDSIIFTLNGNNQKIQLNAWGQNVRLIRDSVLKTQTWTSEKPILLYETALVDTNETLTIEKGTTIYVHRNGWLVVDGKIIVNGTRESPVVFRGDRLDAAKYTPPVAYDKIPGQWGEIWIRNTSSGNKFSFTEIRNGQFGIVAGVLNETGKAEVELEYCKIINNSVSAIFGTNSKIKASNCIFANSGYADFACATGGEYEFYQCTFASYSVFGNSGISLVLQNFAKYTSDNTGADTISYGDLKKAYFGNCLIYGDSPEEAILLGVSDYKFEYTFDHCLIKGTTDKLNVADQQRFIKTKLNSKTNPGFKKIDIENYIFDFNLEHTSIARDVGSSEISVIYPFDFDGHRRTEDDSPDAGAFEYSNSEKK